MLLPMNRHRSVISHQPQPARPSLPLPLCIILVFTRHQKKPWLPFQYRLPSSWVCLLCFLLPRGGKPAAKMPERKNPFLRFPSLAISIALPSTSLSSTGTRGQRKMKPSRRLSSSGSYLSWSSTPMRPPPSCSADAANGEAISRHR